MKDKLDVANEEVENLENQVTEAQKKATEAEEKSKALSKNYSYNGALSMILYFDSSFLLSFSYKSRKEA